MSRCARLGIAGALLFTVAGCADLTTETKTPQARVSDAASFDETPVPPDTSSASDRGGHMIGTGH
jgi:hypothetical protein